MAGTIFWDVDTQYDFIMPDGKLYIQGAEEILPNLSLLTSFARRNNIQVLGSIDYHTLYDPEISSDPDFQTTFPPHCLRDKRSPGKALCPNLSGSRCNQSHHTRTWRILGLRMERTGRRGSGHRLSNRSHTLKPVRSSSPHKKTGFLNSEIPSLLPSPHNHSRTTEPASPPYVRACQSDGALAKSDRESVITRAIPQYLP